MEVILPESREMTIVAAVRWLLRTALEDASTVIEG